MCLFAIPRHFMAINIKFMSIKCLMLVIKNEKKKWPEQQGNDIYILFRSETKKKFVSVWVAISGISGFISISIQWDKKLPLIRWHKIVVRLHSPSESLLPASIFSPFELISAVLNSRMIATGIWLLCRRRRLIYLFSFSFTKLKPALASDQNACLQMDTLRVSLFL